MKSWFVRAVTWSVVGIAAFALTLALTAGSNGTGFDVPAWVPLAGLALLFVGGSVLRRALLDQNDA
jgi:hypothetical protein